MITSVNILYSAQDFLQIVENSAIDGPEFAALDKTFVIAKPSDVFSLATKCDWISLDDRGVCVLTARGQRVLDQTGSVERLKLQIFDLIEREQPTWAVRIRAGRREAWASFPTEIRQIFEEAGFYEDTPSEDIVLAWDGLSCLVNANRAKQLLEIGRNAEKLSLRYERLRTGKTPKWQAVESNYSGYDIASVVDADHEITVLIEVKGTEQKIKDAFFHLTRNEWRIAQKSPFYKFHLWVLRDNPILLDVDTGMVEPHIPTDTNDGKWESVKIPFKVFSDVATHPNLNQHFWDS
jgi:hypothetical protein